MLLFTAGINNMIKPFLNKCAFMHKTLLSALLVLILLPSVLHADEKRPALGLLASTTGESNTAGFVYDFESGFSIKPQFTFYQVNTGWMTYGAALQFDRTSAVSDTFSVYYGIEAGYRYDYRNFHYSDGSRFKITDNYFSASVVAGGKYMLHERFGFFADTGLSYTREYSKNEECDTSGIITRDDSWSNIFSIKSARLGAVFYLF